jgi:hypothetical protein
MGEQLGDGHEREIRLTAGVEETRLLQAAQFLNAPLHHAVLFGAIAANQRGIAAAGMTG